MHVYRQEGQHHSTSVSVNGVACGGGMENGERETEREREAERERMALTLVTVSLVDIVFFSASGVSSTTLCHPGGLCNSSSGRVQSVHLAVEAARA